MWSSKLITASKGRSLSKSTSPFKTDINTVNSLNSNKFQRTAYSGFDYFLIDFSLKLECYSILYKFIHKTLLEGTVHVTFGNPNTNVIFLN